MSTIRKRQDAARPEDLSDRIIRSVCDRLSQSKRVRRALPVWGRVAIDRELPFLCVYRRPVRRFDDGTDRLVTSEPSYLTCSANRKQHDGLSRLVEAIAEQMVAEFGAFLVLEIWSGDALPKDQPVSTATIRPQFRVIERKSTTGRATTDMLEESLSQIKMGKRSALVSTTTRVSVAPRGMPPILSSAAVNRIGCHLYGLEVSPIYRDSNTETPYPRVLRDLRRSLSGALKRVFFRYSREFTRERPTHFLSLGRRAVVKAVWEADRLLSEAANEFDFLLQITPVNSDRAWHEFKRRRFERKPAFHYRPLVTDPIILKRKLYKAPVERIEDPALGGLFREKLDEIDLHITMLQDRGSSRFMHGSIQLYGGVEDELFRTAESILDGVRARSRASKSKQPVRADAFARRAQDEIATFRSKDPTVDARVEVREDVSGLMVSNGNLLIGKHLQVPVERVEALIQHEVGTHVLTFHNGRAQKLRQLSAGLAGYEGFQEGLAVLAEFLVGGLDRARLRLLAARVVAIRRMLDGAKFTENFRALTRDDGLNQRTAFVVAMRTYRSGGLTKDAMYLRGFGQIIDYLGKGGRLRPLFTGKISARHIPIIEELYLRGVLKKPTLQPTYLSHPDALTRLEKIRKGLAFTDLLKGQRP